MSNDQVIYLDHAAATPLDPRVERAMQPFFSENFYNPSSPYAPAVAVRHAYEAARHDIAIELGVQKDDCIMTAGATESVNLALTTAHEGHIVAPSIEHPAVREAMKQYEHTVVDVKSDGSVDPQTVARAITATTQLVSVALANSELGTIQPLREIADIVQRERAKRQEVGDKRPLWLHCDASQGVGQLDVRAKRLGVDLLTVNAGKIYGPKQVGLLWRRPGVELFPIIYGGRQENGLRSGTENVAGVVGFAEAMKLASNRRVSETKRIQTLRDEMQHRLVEQFDSSVVFFGNQKKRLASHLSLSFPGIDAERLMYMLESRGVLVATGSACAANKGRGSHVLRGIGATESEVQGSLRITLGKLNDDDTIRIATTHLIEVVNLERRRVAR